MKSCLCRSCLGHNVQYMHTAAAAAKSLQSCPTLCDPTDSSPRGSPIPGILQARILEWGAFAFSEYMHIHIQTPINVLGLRRIIMQHYQEPRPPPYHFPMSDLRIEIQQMIL